MKYLSICVSILFIWIAAVLTALTVQETSEIFKLYVAVTTLTVILFLIGFTKSK
jgi:hypothetical protein